MRIFVPSRGRARDKLQYTINQLPPYWTERTTLVVRPDEFVAYEELAESMGVELLQRPTECWNLSMTLDWLVHEYEAGDDHIVLADDDIRFSYRRDPTRLNMAKASYSEVQKVFEDIAGLLRAGYPLVGICARQGMNSHFPKKIRYGIRQMQLHGVNRPYFREHDIHYNQVRVKSDFHTTLAVLESGMLNAVITEAAVDQAKGANAAGGVSNYRTVPLMNEGAHRLKELHPEYVGIVRKTTQWKGLGSVERDEVRIAWKNAALRAKHPAGK